MPPVLFAVESAQSRSAPLNSQRLVNAHIERQAPDAKGPAPIFGMAGLTAFQTVGPGPHRGGWNFNGLAYFVSQFSLYSLTSGGTVTLLGTGITGNNPVSMSDNGVQLCIVNGVAGWIYTVSGGLQQITDPNFFPSQTVIFMDGYFIFERTGTNEWFLSALYDGTTFNGLDFATAEAKPGFLIGLYQNLQLLFLFCSEHIEIWYDSGAADFPFDRYAGGVINYGCISPYTIVGQDGAIFFLGADKTFYRLQANVPVRVSSHSMEHIIAQDADITQAYCTTYTLEGHKFVCLTLPVSGRTLVFDISTGKWHERESWGANNASLGIWRAATILEVYQKILVGDAFTGQVGYLDWTVNTEYGNTIRLLARSAPMHHDRLKIFVSKFELDMQAGVGLATGLGSNPLAVLRFSRDGGETWSKYQPPRSIGTIGAYLQRLRWKSLGSGRQYVFEITITDPVVRVIMAAHADFAIGMG